MLKGRSRINWAILMRRRSVFKKTDVTRAARAVLAAGLDVARIEVNKDGKIIIVPGKPDACTSVPGNPWDEVLTDAENEKRAS
jgi:hypothetical protein